MGWKLLLVCTGNTCRSPMAQGLAQALFGPEVEVSSAGLEAWDGEVASALAIQILHERGVDISGHQARQIRAEFLEDVDWIIPMTKAQASSLQRLFPHLGAKIKCLGDWGEKSEDIKDPWGGSAADYQQCAQKIEEYLHYLKQKLD